MSPLTVSPVEVSNATPRPSGRTAVARAERCSSHRSRASSVNRREISGSMAPSNRGPRLTIRTSTPRRENTWANSAAMYPPPRMTMEAGSSSIRMTVSEV
jgi:hypothetical protein